MNRVLAVVEGQTEQTFVRDLLAPHLAAHGVFLTARLVGKPGHKGGIRSYAAGRRELISLLLEDRHVIVTTMLDFSGLPMDWPLRAEAHKYPVPQRAELVEKAIREDIAREIGDSLDARRIIPYVQLHEFESLLFAEPRIVAESAQQPEAAMHLNEILGEFRDPEAINDSSDSYPSKRIKRLIPGYEKALHGPIAAKCIGIEPIRKRCNHFAGWLNRLELLARQ